MTDTTAGREFDVVVWGATGFTGRLVAEYLLERYGAGQELRWAMAGRNEGKLEEIRAGLGKAAGAVPLLIGDSHEPASLDAIVVRTTAICSTVGPFAKYGSELVAACARAGTHYCDITGEVQWIRRMIDAHEATARDSGARLVHCCGFDSIPSDLGCLYLMNAMQAQHGQPCESVGLRVRKMRGAFSGGTTASILNAVEEGRRDRDARRTMGDPYGLNPEGERSGPDGRDQVGPKFDDDLDAWTAPFIMAAINTRVVRRSNALMHYAYGRNFRYDEAMLTGRGLSGYAKATAVTLGLGGLVSAASLGPTRSLLGKLVFPKPGEGPSREERETGFFDIVLVGRTGGETPAQLRARVRGDRDPGYGATSRMLGESVVCLAKDPLAVTGGSWTPASCMGTALIDRLEANAGMRFGLMD